MPDFSIDLTLKRARLRQRVKVFFPSVERGRDCHTVQDTLSMSFKWFSPRLS